MVRTGSHPERSAGPAARFVARSGFGELAEQWLDRQAQRRDLRASSLYWYAAALRLHVVPRIGALEVGEVTVDQIAEMVRELQQAGYAGSTITSILIPTNQIFDHAVRRGLARANPVRGLERHERPKIVRVEMRILDRDEIDRLLQAAPDKYRTVLATAIFTGLRLGELTGLRWVDVDLAAGLIRVRRQAYSAGQTGPLKTPNARRDVLLTPALAQLLGPPRRIAVPRRRPFSLHASL
jgi:integrase